MKLIIMKWNHETLDRWIKKHPFDNDRINTIITMKINIINIINIIKFSFILLDL